MTQVPSATAVAGSVGAHGLTPAEVLRRRERDGANVVPPPARTPAWRLLLARLTHVVAGMLWVAALLVRVAGMAALAGAIVVIVLLNGVFAFVRARPAPAAAPAAALGVAAAVGAVTVLHALLPDAVKCPSCRGLDSM